jgi:hypothetical protein
MDTSELALEITRLKIRCEIYEVLLSRIRFFQLLVPVSPLPNPEKAIQRARDQVLEELEGIAQASEKRILGSSAMVHDSEKALYADEIREIVEHMKSYMDVFTGKKS